MDLVDDVELKPYSEEELKVIEDAKTPYIRSILFLQKWADIAHLLKE